MATISADGRDPGRDLTVHTLTCAVAAILDGAHVAATVLLITAAEGALESHDRALAVDILRQAQREVQQCTSQ